MRLPAEYLDVFESTFFGTQPNGDVVRALVDNENSLTWADAYQNDIGLDPDLDTVNPDPNNPLYVQGIDGERLILGSANLGSTVEELQQQPFNMTFSTTLSQFVRARVIFGQPDVISVQPIILATDNWVRANAPQLCEPPEGESGSVYCETTRNWLADVCGGLANLSEAVNGFTCQSQIDEAQNFPNGVYELSLFQSLGFKSATWAETIGITAVTPFAELPGNRGEPRNFELAWR